MQKIIKLLFVIISLLCATFQSRSQKSLKLTDNEYFNTNQYSLLLFHNHYAVGKQGGIELILHNNRVATNGNLVIETTDNKKIRVFDPVRTINPKKNTAELHFQHKELELDYTIQIQPINGDFQIEAKINSDIDQSKIRAIYFEIEFYPGDYAGKTYIADNNYGVFPYHFTGKLFSEHGETKAAPLASAKLLEFAPNDPERNIVLQSQNQQLQLTDNRYFHHINWYVVHCHFNIQNPKSIAILFKPNHIPGWEKQPVITYSQVGYHPNQPKKAIIELDANTKKIETAQLIKIDRNQTQHTVLKAIPTIWGKYLRYKYAIFNFSDVKIGGIYKLKYGKQETAPFKIDSNIYKKQVWQPTLTTFMPVQMCHVKVKDRERLWHGKCHLDDGLQAPAPIKFYDGFSQNQNTDTKFKPETTIPGMNIGGWHDAGDDDINTGSNGRNIYGLALCINQFNVRYDQTTIDFNNKEVFINQPDGKPDMHQQLKHGILWILAQYEACNHSFAGVISSSWETYLQAGDWAQYTDNLFYNSSYPTDSTDGKFSGKKDDRYIFTNKDTGREYYVAAFLAASYRALLDYDPELAKKCLSVAQQIWHYETTHKPEFYPNVGTPRNWKAQKINACVELYLATKDKKYMEHIVENSTDVFNEMNNTAWTVSRIIKDIDNQNFKNSYTKHLKQYANDLKNTLSKNPYGIVDPEQIWGIGWEIIWMLHKHYFLIKNYPELFPNQQLYNGVHYMLGCHPYSNLSFVSGIGSHQPIPAFGVNRHHNSYIFGGVYSGTAKILPDFPELKDDTPYIWQQTEYIISGAAPFIFCVLASDQLLNKK